MIQSFKYGDERTYFLDSFSWKALRVFHLVVHVKNNRNACVNDQKPGLKGEIQTLPLFATTPCQLLHKIGGNAGLLVVET